MPLEQTGFGSRVHSLYVILIAFGLERMVEGAYNLWFASPHTSLLKHAANLVVLAAVASWGARLFWSATNVERYAKRKSSTAKTGTAKLFAIHMPILLGQSALFFWICESYRTAVVPMLTGQADLSASAEQFAHIVLISLIYNTLWLMWLLERPAPKNCPEPRWIANNVAFAAAISFAIPIMERAAPDNVASALLVFGGLLLANSAVDFLVTGAFYLEN